MRRITRIQKRKRQTWLALPASGIEELGHGQIITGTVGQGSAEASGGRREGIAAQGQADEELAAFLSYPRHEIVISENVARKFEEASKSELRREPGD